MILRVMLSMTDMIRGSLSYCGEGGRGVHYSDTIDIVMESLDDDIARIRLLHRQTKQQVPLTSIPPIRLTNSSGHQVPAIHDSFFVTWANSYRLFVGDNEILGLTTQKQQALHATAHTLDKFFTLPRD
jgi:hypothetical protein